MDTSGRVKQLIVKQNQTQKKFAETIGISPARLNNYLAGLSKIPQDILVRISEMHGCSLSWLIKGEGEMFRDVHESVGNLPMFVTIPVSCPIAAGFPIEAYQDEPIEILQLPASILHLPPPYYAFKVQGESMSPYILDGDTVVLSRDWRGIKLNNRICGFRTPDGITLKKLIYQSRQKTTWLMPLNHSFEPVPYNKDTDELTLFGVLVLSLRRYI